MTLDNPRRFFFEQSEFYLLYSTLTQREQRERTALNTMAVTRTANAMRRQISQLRRENKQLRTQLALALRPPINVPPPPALCVSRPVLYWQAYQCFNRVRCAWLTEKDEDRRAKLVQLIERARRRMIRRVGR